MIYKRLKIIQALFIAALIASCSTVIEPPNGMVDWSLANTTGSKVTMSVYDKVCNRSYFRVPYLGRARSQFRPAQIQMVRRMSDIGDTVLRLPQIIHGLRQS